MRFTISAFVRFCIFATTFGASVSGASTASSKSSSSLESRLHFSSPKAAKFAVGNDIPSVGFQTRNSWAGEMPIGNKAGDPSYFFWLWGATEEGSVDDTVIWLNGGPGCSSLLGMLEEIGDFVYLPGEKKPRPNPDTWLRAANVLFVEQPANVGFSTASKETINTEDDIARDFHGFLSNLEDSFPELFAPGKRLWIAGESYAGTYIPYIAHEILQKGNRFNLNGIMLYDPVIAEEVLSDYAPLHLFVKQHNDILQLKASDVDAINALTKSCGYDTLLKDYLVYPSKGKLPDYSEDGCLIFEVYEDAAYRANPNFNIYRISDRANRPSVLGDGNSGDDQNNHKTWFDNVELQRYIHAPSKKWNECLPFSDQHLFPNGDKSPPPEQSGLLEKLIETLPSQRTIIVNGELDGLVTTPGVALALQNLTWRGTRGFTEPITETLTDLTGKVSGRYRTQRGLTFAIVDGAGHTGPSPQDAPSVGLKLVKYMLGQTKTLG